MRFHRSAPRFHVSYSAVSPGESISQLVDSNDDEVHSILKKAGIEPNAPSVVNVGEDQFRVYFKNGTWHGKGVFNGELHRFTGKDRDTVLGKIMKLAKRDSIRDLTRSQEIEVARLCQMGRRTEGIARYLEYRIGKERGNRYDSPEEMTSDVALQGVMAECALFCWLNSRPDVTNSSEFQEFLSAYAGTRPINFDLLDACWIAFQQEPSIRLPDVRKPDKPATTEELEDADDETINKTFWGTVKHIAKSGR